MHSRYWFVGNRHSYSNPEGVQTGQDQGVDGQSEEHVQGSGLRTRAGGLQLQSGACHWLDQGGHARQGPGHRRPDRQHGRVGQEGGDAAVDGTVAGVAVVGLQELRVQEGVGGAHSRSQPVQRLQALHEPAPDTHPEQEGAGRAGAYGQVQVGQEHPEQVESQSACGNH